MRNRLMNTSRREHLTAVGTLLGAALLVGCGGGPEHTGSEKYFLLATNTQIPYWQSANAGLRAAGRQLGVEVEMVGPDRYDPQAEVQAFRDAVAQNPAGVLVSATDPRLIAPEINAAVEKGIPVITIDSDAPESKRLFFVGTDNYKAGVMGGDLVAKELRGKGNVVIYSMPEQLNLSDRVRGYRDAFARHAGIRIVEVLDIKGDPKRAADLTAEIAEKRANQVDAFICVEAIAAEEVAQALESRNITGKVIMGMDTNERTLEYIKKGTIVATIAQKPYTMAFHGLRLLADYNLYKLATVDGQSTEKDPFAEVPTFINTGATIVDKTNVEQFLSDQAAAGQ